MAILSGVIVAVISIAAGARIRAAAFAVFALFVALGFGILTFVKGSPTPHAIVSSIALLLLMEICYIGGVFFWGLLRRARRPSATKAIADPSHTPGK
ncbi:hypothetical protein I6F07_27740 [Ensifer sp. IC4062]|nr:hypothetical protein [Ensifer sp. IC4062]MCA1443933.1 hypothetical protein [Ensifer sp. IC4062]